MFCKISFNDFDPLGTKCHVNSFLYMTLFQTNYIFHPLVNSFQKSSNFGFYLACQENKIGNFDSYESMIYSGWVFENINAGIEYGTSFTGWSHNDNSGSLSITLKGMGNVILNYGNHYDPNGVPFFILIYIDIKVQK